jgi:predicted SAM-dependent methyltransferase
MMPQNQVVTLSNGAQFAWNGVPPVTPPTPPSLIQQLGAVFLKGSGIEIGALHRPMPLPPKAQVRYVDRLCIADLRKHYPEFAALPIVEPDIIDNGETLATIPDGSCDFVIANHFLEHTEDPISTVATFLRVLKPGGIAFMAIPDKRYTFDQQRPVTPFAHVLRDYREGPAWSRMEAFEEFVRLVDKVTAPDEFRKKLKERLDQDSSIHFHVWTNKELSEFFSRLQSELHFPFEIAASFADYGWFQVVFVLQKL